MTLRRILIAACIMTLTPNAAALSCKPPNLLKRMEDAKASEDVYYVLSGTFTPQTEVPAHAHFNLQNQHKKRPPITVNTLFNGVSLTPNHAPNVPMSNVPVNVKTSCVLAWCSSVPAQNKDRIAFVVVKPGQAPLLEIAPCSRNVFSVSQNKKEIGLLKSCFEKPCNANPEPRRAY